MDVSTQASALAERFSRASLCQEALECLETSTGPWVIGCSGGVDSVFLTRLIHALYPERTCVVAHYNHALRGPASDADACFVEALAKALGFECVIQRAQRGLVSGSGASEAVLRAERFAFFENVLKEHAAQVLLLAHQADDVAETLLMRVARGSGLSGLCAPRPVSVQGGGYVRVRPILTLMRADIEAALRALGITWRDDASNVSDDYFRNRIRHRVLPVLKEASPTRLLPNVLHTRSLLQEDDAALEAWVDMLFEKTAFSHPLAVSVLQGKPRALCRRVLYRWLHAHQLSLTRMLFERILCAIDGQKTGLWSVRADALVVLQNGCLSLEVATQPERTWPVRGFLIPGGSVFFPNGFVLHAEQIPLTAALISSVMQGRVDPQKEAYLIPPLALPLSVRPHRSGDRFHPLGAAGSKKLKDCFTDKKIPLTARARLPVVFSAEGEVLWCPGFPPSEKSRLEHGNLYALRLTYSSSDCLLNSFSL